MFYADAMAFLGKRGGPIEIDPALDLNLALVTATPPVTLSKDDEVRPLTMSETLEKVQEFKKMIANQPRLRLVLSKNELKKAIADKKIAVILGLQNAPTGVAPQALFDAGIRVMSLAYYEENDLGSGFLNGGIKLKKFGEKVLRQCADSGMIVDFSHVGHRTALDSLSFIKKENLNCCVMASHSGCVPEYHHPRNILDKMMRGIVDLEGVVGITTITFNLDERSNRRGAFVKHLKHAVNICGENSVVIGSDSVYVKRTVEEAKKGIELLTPRLDELGIQGIRYPENIREGPKLMNDICATILAPDISTILAFPGYTEHGQVPNVDGIMGQNLLNFFERALPAE